MIFLKAVVMVLATVSSLNFVIPSRNEVVRRRQQYITVAWMANDPAPDLPEYTLGICSSDQCSATKIQIDTFEEFVDTVIDKLFPENGIFSFCVFTIGTPASKETALYVGPPFEITGEKLIPHKLTYNDIAKSRVHL